METEFYLFSYSQVNKLDIYSFVHELEILQHVKLIALKPKWIYKDTVTLKQMFNMILKTETYECMMGV